MGKDVFTVAAIYGSPRPDGNTAALMDRLLEGLRDSCRHDDRLDIRKIEVSRLDISPCRECGHCSLTGECRIDDDMQEVFEVLVSADFIAVSSPVFFTTVSGYLKALIDRCQRFWVLKYIRKEKVIDRARKGVFIGAAGSGSSTIFDCPRKVIRSFFDVLYVDYAADFLYGETDSRGDIMKNSQALDEVYRFGKKIDTG